MKDLQSPTHPLVSTVAELLSVCNDYGKPFVATIVTRTKVKMNKNDVETKTIVNPYDEIWKIQSKQVVLNPAYEATVNEQLETEGKEPKFVANVRKWGNNMGAMLLRDGAYYLKMIVQATETPTYAVSIPGNPRDLTHAIPFEDFAAFVPKPSSGKSQGTENTVLFITVNMDNVIHIQSDIVDYI